MKHILIIITAFLFTTCSLFDRDAEVSTPAIGTMENPEVVDLADLNQYDYAGSLTQEEHYMVIKNFPHRYFELQENSGHMVAYLYNDSFTIELDSTGTSENCIVLNQTLYLKLECPADSLPVDFTIAGAARCGDGLVDAGEECDDANTQDGDGCSSQCLQE